MATRGSWRVFCVYVRRVGRAVIVFRCVVRFLRAHEGARQELGFGITASALDRPDDVCLQLLLELVSRNLGINIQHGYLVLKCLCVDSDDVLNVWAMRLAIVMFSPRIIFGDSPCPLKRRRTYGRTEGWSGQLRPWESSGYPPSSCRPGGSCSLAHSKIKSK